MSLTPLSLGGLWEAVTQIPVTAPPLERERAAIRTPQLMTSLKSFCFFEMEVEEVENFKKSKLRRGEEFLLHSFLLFLSLSLSLSLSIRSPK
jgi:hypothetical protein